MVDPGALLAIPRAAAGSALPWAVVGAGPHGLAALKALLQVGVAAQGFERAADVGGLWNPASDAARSYASLHMVSSAANSQFPDFPMPLDYPVYPSGEQAQAYLQRYASHFGLYDHIRFGSAVRSVTPVGGQVDITVRDVVTGQATTSTYAGAVIATGPQRVPRRPRIPGLEQFPGTVLHAADYRSPEQLRGRRVLVIGGGSSGCDIAVDAGREAAAALLSTRRGLRVTPTLALGRPVDQLAELLGALRVPMAVRDLLQAGLRRACFGSDFDRSDGRGGPTARNPFLPALIGCGRVMPKPAVERLDEGLAVFVDGSSAQVDAVVLATGYRAEVPFGLSPEQGVDGLGRGVFHPGEPQLAMTGLLAADGGQWPTAHWQGMLIAHYARARRDRAAVARAYVEDVPLLPIGWSGSTGRLDRQRYLHDLERDIRVLEGWR